MAGVEAVGIVLAVLPLLIEGAKAYDRGAGALLDIGLQSRYDERLQDFYKTFLFEVAMLKGTIGEVVQGLPNVEDERKSELVQNLDLQDWQQGTDVSNALEALFGGSLEAFNIAITEVMDVLGELVQDQRVRVSVKGDDRMKPYMVLKSLYEDRKHGRGSSTLMERFKFWKSEEKRNKKLKKLHKWIKKLGRLTSSARIAPSIPTPVDNTSATPEWQKTIDGSKVLGRTLYTALSRCWECPCSSRHEARFCLRIFDRLISRTDVVESEFDFLIQTENDDHTPRWREGVILVRRKGTSEQNRKALTRICDALHGVTDSSFCMHALVEDLQGKPQAWHLRPQPRRLQYFHDKPSVTLQDLLSSSTPLPLPVKRELAFTIALSSMGLHEHTWLLRGWGKQSISFFHDSDERLDYYNPFISTFFEVPPMDDPLSNVLCHKNQRILSLGILLIEIHLGRTLESFRREGQDISNGQANPYTDIIIAERILDGLTDCSSDYRGAIQACLQASWLPNDQEISLDDSRVRVGMYRDVLNPLKRELDWLQA